MAALCGFHAGPARAASGDAGTQLSRMLAGVLGYARWPASPSSYRFCVVGEVSRLRAAQSALGALLDRPLAVRALVGNKLLLDDCDVLYVGTLPAAARRSVLLAALGKPVLSISENDALCAGPAMFCIAFPGPEVSLLANLDAISRSEVRINPKVLQLIARKQGAQ